MKFIVDATREREHSGRSGRRTCDEGHAACMEEQEPAGRHQISVGWIVDREERREEQLRKLVVPVTLKVTRLS